VNSAQLGKIKLKICERGTEGNHTAGQIFDSVNAQYLRNGLTEIHQIYREFLAHTTAQNLQKTISKF